MIPLTKLFKSLTKPTGLMSTMNTETPSSSPSRNEHEHEQEHENEIIIINELKLPDLDIDLEDIEGGTDSTTETDFYFSYGSNMLPSHLEKCKDIEPYSIRRGILPGYRLSFSCTISTNKSDPCFANIVSYNNDNSDNNDDNIHPYVEGCIIELNPAVFTKLDGYEFTYKRKQVKAQIYDDDGGGIINVWTYIMDKKHEQYLNQKYPQQKYEFIEKQPSKNYLNILIEGAKAIGLHRNYIQYLQSQCFQNYLKLPSKMKLLQNMKDMDITWTMKQIINWHRNKGNKEHHDTQIKGPLTVLKGIVFDLNKSPLYFQSTYGGHDITLIQAQRWVFANHINTKSISSLENEQKLFINNVLMGALMGGSILGKCVGTLSQKDYKYGYHYYEW